MSTWLEYYNDYKAKMEQYSDEELIQRFNTQVRIRAFNIARSALFAAIRKEFDERNFDYSAIGSEKSMSYFYKITLSGKTIMVNDTRRINKQEKMVQTFKELKDKIEKLNSQVIALTWRYRCAFRLHLNSNYMKEDELNIARISWEKKLKEEDAYKSLYEMMTEHRDKQGYFNRHFDMIDKIKSVLEIAVENEDYEIAMVLHQWLKEIKE